MVVVGSRDYNIRGNFLIRSDTIRFIFFSFEKFAVVVGSRDYNITQNLLTLDWIYIPFTDILKSLRWWWAVGTIDSTLVLRLGLDWTGLGLGLDNCAIMETIMSQHTMEEHEDIWDLLTQCINFYSHSLIFSVVLPSLIVYNLFIWWYRWVSGEEYYHFLYFAFSVAQTVQKLQVFCFFCSVNGFRESHKTLQQ